MCVCVKFHTKIPSGCLENGKKNFSDCFLPQTIAGEVLVDWQCVLLAQIGMTRIRMIVTSPLWSTGDLGSKNLGAWMSKITTTTTTTMMIKDFYAKMKEKHQTAQLSVLRATYEGLHRSYRTNRSSFAILSLPPYLSSFISYPFFFCPYEVKPLHSPASSKISIIGNIFRPTTAFRYP